MHFAKFWATASEGGFHSWRWSDTSLEDAKQSAQRAARDLLTKFQNGVLGTRSRSGYGYGGPFREEVIKEVAKDGSTPTSLISRNRMGCLVLNSSEVMFIDIDNPGIQAGASFVQKLFGGKGKGDSARAESIRNIAERVQRSFGLGCRLYETKAGHRLLFTEATFSPTSPDVTRLFEELKADPLYAKLCKAQESFRARLTPKPWRCGCAVPSARWPFKDKDEHSNFLSWLREYEGASESYATCRFVQSFGSTMVHRCVQPVLEEHDMISKAASGLPLA